MSTVTRDAPSRPTTRSAARRTIALAASCDVGSILLFVLVGRRSHDEGGSYLAETAKVAASFLIGLLVAWAAARAWRAPRSVRTGLAVWLVTLAVGIALRPVFGRDVPGAFVVVTAIVTAILMLGWRWIARTLAVRRAGRQPGTPAASRRAT